MEKHLNTFFEGKLCEPPGKMVDSPKEKMVEFILDKPALVPVYVVCVIHIRDIIKIEGSQGERVVSFSDLDKKNLPGQDSQ